MLILIQYLTNRKRLIMKEIKQLLINEKNKYKKVKEYGADILEFVEEELNTTQSKEPSLFFEDRLYQTYNEYLKTIGSLTIIILSLIDFNHDCFVQGMKDN